MPTDMLCEIIMIFLILTLCTANSGTGCPPGTQYFFDQTIEIKIEPKSWFYFYTSHAQRVDPLFYEIKSENPVSVYVNLRPKCPTESDEPIALIGGGNKTERVFVQSAESHTGMIVNGLYSELGTKVQLKMLGQGKKKPLLSNFMKLTLLFLTMSLASATFFVKCVLPPIKKEKAD